MVLHRPIETTAVTVQVESWYGKFPASNAVATHSQGPYPVAPVVVTQALIGTWTA
jgi:hypothetical protein